MSEMFKGSTKSEPNKEGKTFWSPVGFTLFVGEYEGKTTYSMIDDRNGKRVSFFPPWNKDKDSDGDKGKY